MSIPDPCRARCYDLVGAPSRDAVFQNTKLGTAVANCFTQCDAGDGGGVAPTLARVLVAGNTTSDIDNLAGNPIVGNEYTIDLDSSPSGIISSLPTTALAGVDLTFEAQASTSGGGGDIGVTAGAATVSGDGGNVGVTGGAGAGGGGGGINLTAGAGGSLNGGSVTSIGGSGASVGGSVTATSGNGGASGGIFSATGGDGGTAGGGVTLTGGTGTLGQGGSITGVCGNGRFGGDFTVTCGDGVTTGTGGSVQITAGSSVINDAGSITLTAGVTTAGVPGPVTGANITVQPGYFNNAGGGVVGQAGSFVIDGGFSDPGGSAQLVALQGTMALPTITSSVGAFTGLVVAGSSDMAGQVVPTNGFTDLSTQNVQVSFSNDYWTDPFIVVHAELVTVHNSYTVTPGVNPGESFIVTADGAGFLRNFTWIVVGNAIAP